MKISVIGYSVSGKSTFSEKISKHFNVPLLHIDKVYFSENMKINDKDETIKKIQDFMKQKKWLIDGTYRKIVTERYDKATKIFIFDFNRLKCFYGYIVRYFKYKNKGQRPSMADGNPEKFDFGFVKWILWDGRKKDSKKLFRNIEKKYEDKVIVFKNRKEVNNYLKQLAIDKT